MPAVKFIFTCQIVGSTLVRKASKTCTTLVVSSTAAQPQPKGRPKKRCDSNTLKKKITHSRRASQCLQVCPSDIEKCYNVQQKWNKKKKKKKATISRPCVAKAQASAASLTELASVDLRNCITLYLNWSAKWLPHTSVGGPRAACYNVHKETKKGTHFHVDVTRQISVRGVCQYCEGIT